jgi:hypothetical protein
LNIDHRSFTHGLTSIKMKGCSKLISKSSAAFEAYGTCSCKAEDEAGAEAEAGAAAEEEEE